MFNFKGLNRILLNLWQFYAFPLTNWNFLPELWAICARVKLRMNSALLCLFPLKSGHRLLQAVYQESITSGVQQDIFVAQYLILHIDNCVIFISPAMQICKVKIYLNRVRYIALFQVRWLSTFPVCQEYGQNL